MIIDAPLHSQYASLRALWKEAFADTDDFLDIFERAAFSPARCRRLSVNGEVLSALYWLDCTANGARIAYIYAVATSESARGKGLGSRLLENTHSHLAELGYDGAILVPGGKRLFAFYERLGYKTACYITDHECAASDKPATLTQIGAEEYAVLRRQYLPSGAVIQEGENLALLSCTAKLYRGEDFIIAIRNGSKIADGIELLGNVEDISGITRALGFEYGKFRSPGHDRAFAMYLPFTDAPAPTYFGIAFD